MLAAALALQLALQSMHNSKLLLLQLRVLVLRHLVAMLPEQLPLALLQSD